MLRHVGLTLHEVFVGVRGGTSLFEQMFRGAGGGCQDCRQPAAGADLHYTLAISLEDVLHGAEKTVSLRQPDGVQQSISVRVPRGIENGKKLRVAGKGAPSASGGPNGDMYLKIQLAPHPRFSAG